MSSWGSSKTRYVAGSSMTAAGGYIHRYRVLVSMLYCQSYQVHDTKYTRFIEVHRGSTRFIEVQ